jgi:hypothetical protein
MRAYFTIAALIALAMLAVARTASTQYRVIGCTADCEVEADNGIGLSLPDPHDDDDN